MWGGQLQHEVAPPTQNSRLLFTFYFLPRKGKTFHCVFFYIEKHPRSYKDDGQISEE